MNDFNFNVGDNAWFIIKGSDGGWMSVQRRITQMLGHWVWLIAAFIIGGSAGLLVTALLVAGREKE